MPPIPASGFGRGIVMERLGSDPALAAGMVTIEDLDEEELTPHSYPGALDPGAHDDPSPVPDPTRDLLGAPGRIGGELEGAEHG